MICFLKSIINTQLHLKGYSIINSGTCGNTEKNNAVYCFGEKEYWEDRRSIFLFCHPWHVASVTIHNMAAGVPAIISVCLTGREKRQATKTALLPNGLFLFKEMTERPTKKMFLICLHLIYGPSKL